MSGIVIRRVVISEVREGQIKRFDANGITGEQFLDREMFQQFGLTSRPAAGAEGILIGSGNVFYMIATDDRALRPAIAEGEMAIYTDADHYILIKASGDIEVKSSTKVTVNAPAVELGDGATFRKLIDERFQAKFEAHKHLLSGVMPGAAAIQTGVPDNAPLTLDDIATTNTEAS